MKQISIPSFLFNIVQTEKLKKLRNDPLYIIFQHNNLIEAKYSLTLQEKRLILWLISQIQPNEEDFKEHKLTVTEFMNLMSLSGKANYKELQKITLGLMKKVLTIKNPDLQTTTQVNWLNCSEYFDKKGIIKLSFSPKMKPFLLDLKEKFTAIHITDIMQIKSIHAIRIYELLKQYETIGERILTIEEIKEYCGIKNKLKQYVHFKARILLISQREINNKSDIKFEFEPIKESRKFVAIKFFISKNKAYYKRTQPKQESFNIKRKPPVYYRLKEFGISTRMINQIIKDNYNDIIEEALNVVDIQISKTVVRNPKAMILAAIKEKWNPDKFIIR